MLTGRGAELCLQIEQFIEAHLAEPGLSPAEVAAAVGLSVRHLQRLFARNGTTAAEWIRERRLEHCRSDLCDPRFSRKSITEISFLWGFSDSAHFARSFKTRFGTSPRAFRSRVCTSPWALEQEEHERLTGTDIVRLSRPN
jgi:AraC-like DNA-binding protein